MPNPIEEPGNGYERRSSLVEDRLGDDRDLADMLLDSREIPRVLPARLADLISDLAEALRGRPHPAR